MILDRKLLSVRSYRPSPTLSSAQKLKPTREEKRVIRHIFLWRVAEGHDPAEIVKILNTLPERCPGVVGWEIGNHHGEPNENGDPWDGALISDHESWEALEEYSNHPYHTEVVERLLPRFAERAVVDFERAGS
jgi:hypothetical protein